MRALLILVIVCFPLTFSEWVHARAPAYRTLHDAVEAGDRESVKEWIQSGANINEISPTYGSPMARAAFRGRVGIVKDLLKAGAKTEWKGRGGTTPLYFAAQQGHVHIAQKLLNRGAQVDVSNQNDDTPLYHAIANQHFSIVDFLIRSGANVNRARADGLTPLHWAVFFGNIPMVHRLLELGADANAVSNTWGSPLSLALTSPNASLLVRALIDETYLHLYHEETLSAAIERAQEIQQELADGRSYEAIRDRFYFKRDKELKARPEFPPDTKWITQADIKLLERALSRLASHAKTRKDMKAKLTRVISTQLQSCVVSLMGSAGLQVKGRLEHEPAFSLAESTAEKMAPFPLDLAVAPFFKVIEEERYDKKAIRDLICVCCLNDHVCKEDPSFDKISKKIVDQLGDYWFTRASNSSRERLIQDIAIIFNKTLEEESKNYWSQFSVKDFEQVLYREIRRLTLQNKPAELSDSSSPGLVLHPRLIGIDTIAVR
jgi:hypothetical protein